MPKKCSEIDIINGKCDACPCFETMHSAKYKYNDCSRHCDLCPLYGCVKHEAVLVDSPEPSNVVGYCKECGSEVSTDDAMPPDYPNLYQCPKCSHPHNKAELWDGVPEYLKEEGSAE